MFIELLVSGIVAVAGAVAQASAAPAPASGSALSRSDAEAAARNCGARRFESVAEAIVDGEKKRATIMLCAKPTDTDAQWTETLKKAAAQIAASPTVSAESKAKLRAEFDVAIANIGRSGLAGVAPMPKGGTIIGQPVPSAPLSSTRPARSAPLAALDRLESNVPPLPAPPPPKPAGSGPSLLAQYLAQPQLSVRCLASGETGGGSECDQIVGTMVLVLRAEENFPGPAALRFIRSGDARAEVDLGAMRKGQTRRIRVPGDVCSGVVRSEIELNTVMIDPKTRSEQSGRTLGPVMLRC